MKFNKKNYFESNYLIKFVINIIYYWSSQEAIIHFVSLLYVY